MSFWSRRNRKLGLILTLAFSGSLLIIGCAPPEKPDLNQGAQVVNTGPARVEIQEILNWFPADTETVLAVTKEHQFEQWKEVPELSSLAYLLLIGAPSHSDVLNECKINYGVSATRSYSFNPAVEFVAYEGCTVLSMSDESLERFRAECQESGELADEIDGRSVYLFTEKRASAVWNQFVVFIDDLVFLASDRQFLEETLARRKSGSKREALPLDLAQWGLIDLDSYLWIVREVSEGVPDPDYLTSEIVGFACEIDEEEDALVVFSLLANTDAFDPTVEAFAGIGADGPPSRIDDLTVRHSLLAKDFQFLPFSIAAVIIGTALAI